MLAPAGRTGRFYLPQLHYESVQSNVSIACNQLCFWSFIFCGWALTVEEKWNEGGRLSYDMLLDWFSCSRPSPHVQLLLFYSNLIWHHLQFFCPVTTYTVINTSPIFKLRSHTLSLILSFPLHSVSNGISVWWNLLTEDVPDWLSLCLPDEVTGSPFWWDYMQLCPLRDWTCSFWC